METKHGGEGREGREERVAITAVANVLCCLYLCLAAQEGPSAWNGRAAQQDRGRAGRRPGSAFLMVPQPPKGSLLRWGWCDGVEFSPPTGCFLCVRAHDPPPQLSAPAQPLGHSRKSRRTWRSVLPAWQEQSSTLTWATAEAGPLLNTGSLLPCHSPGPQERLWWGSRAPKREVARH